MMPRTGTWSFLERGSALLSSSRAVHVGFLCCSCSLSVKPPVWAVAVISVAGAAVAVVGLSRVPFERIAAVPPKSSPSPAPAPAPTSSPVPAKSEPVLPSAPVGWNFTRNPGIFRRWCDDGESACAGASEKDFTGNGFTALIVWCRDSPCGSIYAEANLLNAEGVVVGWTNDTGRGGLGDKVLLVFRGQENSTQARITKLAFY
jgi:hypothetical protein